MELIVGAWCVCVWRSQRVLCLAMKADTMEEHCIPVALHGLLSWLLYLSRDCLLRIGTPRSGLVSPTSITEENTL